MTRAIGLVHAHGHSGEDIDEEAKARCRKAASLYALGKVQKLYITAATKQGKSPMHMAMTECLKNYGVHPDDIIVLPKGCVTAGEIDVCISLMEDSDRVISISSWYHLPRVWFLWLTRGKIAGVTAAEFYKGVKARDLLMEPLKFLFHILRPKWSKVLS